MADMTVEALAESLKVPCSRLLEQLRTAGVSICSPHDTVSEEAKLKLLGYLRAKQAEDEQSNGPRRIVLKRR